MCEHTVPTIRFVTTSTSCLQKSSRADQVGLPCRLVTSLSSEASGDCPCLRPLKTLRLSHFNCRGNPLFVSYGLLPPRLTVLNPPPGFSKPSESPAPALFQPSRDPDRTQSPSLRYLDFLSLKCTRRHCTVKHKTLSWSWLFVAPCPKFSSQHAQPHPGGFQA